jgi:hypothetical protein
MSFPQGAGGIVSNPTDLNKFLSCLFNNKLINNKSLNAMRKLKDGYGYGLIQVPFYQKTAIGHNGKIDGFNSAAYYFPEEKLAYSFINNGQVMSSNNISIAILSLYFGKNYTFPTFKPGLKLTNQQLDTYIGIYSSPSFPLKITLFRKGNKLNAQATGQASFPLIAYEKDKFTFDAADIKLEFNQKEKVMVLRQHGVIHRLKRQSEIK